MKTMVREVIKILDNDHHTFGWYEGSGGQKVRTMELNHFRAKALEKAGFPIDRQVFGSTNHGRVAGSSSFSRQGEILPKISRVAPAISSAFDTPLSISARPVLAQIFFTTSAPFSRTIRPRCWTAAAVADLRISSGGHREVSSQ